MALFDYDDKPEQLGGPIDPLARQVDYGARAAANSEGGGGFDWQNLAKAGAHGLLAGMAAGRGDTGYAMRLQAQMDQAAERQRRGKLAEDDMAIRKIHTIKEGIGILEWARENVAEDKKAGAVAGLQDMFKQLGGQLFDDETIQEMISGESPALENLKSSFTYAQKFPPEQQKKWAKDLDKNPERVTRDLGLRALLEASVAVGDKKPISADARAMLVASGNWEKFQKQAGDAVFNQVKQLVNQNGLNKGISRADFEALITNADLLGDDHYTQLVDMGYKELKPVSLMSAQQKSEIVGRAGSDTRTALSAARLVTGKDIKSLEDLTPEEREDVRIYEDAREYQPHLNVLRQQNPNARMGVLLSQAIKDKGQIVVNVRGSAAQAEVIGREHGYQSTIRDRLTRLRDEGEARSGGASATKAREQLASLSQASAIVDEMDALTKGFITATNAFDANIQGAKLFAEKTAAPGSPVGVYESRKKNLAESLARSVGGVKGTATEGDINRMLEGAPGIRETKQSRDYKINAMRMIIDTAIENQTLVMEGAPIDLGKARQEFKKLVDDFLAGKLKTAKPQGQSQSTQSPRQSATMRFNPATGKVEPKQQEQPQGGSQAPKRMRFDAEGNQIQDPLGLR
jgi:hypothetical protein